MKIGILTFNQALNFGANLQACSTYFYLMNNGYEPVFVNYTPRDAVNEDETCPDVQVEVQRHFQRQFVVTEPCHDSKEVAEVLKHNDIKNIIVGSDAVAQHHPLLDRIVFPSKRLVSVMHPSSDKMFPNPFWGEFIQYMHDEVCVCLMSVSNQQSRFKDFSKKDIAEMMLFLPKLKYISVRDEWTQRMYKYISNGTILPPITPDPVFGFNYNCSELIPPRDIILSKYHLPERYILLGIRKGKSVTAEWSKKFEFYCKGNGYECIGLPFPYGFTPLNQVNHKIDLPLSPIDWYAIIKYASGYVGHNMHSIVSALHNSVPCYSFDQYGVRTLMQWCNDKSSKIWDILNRAGFADYRAISGTVINKIPRPSEVLEKLLSFDVEKCKEFSNQYYSQYLDMMSKIEKEFV